MSVPTATANTPLRQAWVPGFRTQARGLASLGLDVLFQVRLGRSGLRARVSLGVLSVSSRTVMNNVGSLLKRSYPYDILPAGLQEPSQ